MQKRDAAFSSRDSLTPWLVTISDGGETITLEVPATGESDARREASEWHPYGRIVAVEAGA